MTFPLVATSPLPWAVLVPVAAIAAWRWLPRPVRHAAVLAEALLVVLMTPLGAHALGRAVAAQGPRARCGGPPPATVVVLAAGFAHTPSGSDDYGALQPLALQRVFAGVALWRTLPGARIVMSGGGPGLPEAVPMANLAVALGVPSAAVEIEDTSSTTWENARNTARLSPRIPRRIWLVTSAMHMPRAVVAFRAWGFAPCAWSVRPSWSRARTGVWSFVPQGSAVATSTIALHELVGGIAYRVRAWSHARTSPHQTP